AEKLRCKDQVDQKLMQWKGGKETNIRALISSLDTVLWEGLGWKTIGLHELVTPAQVKIKCMKAIGKVHPDKLQLNKDL
ncbi:17927_t:CDS:2, partial [Racocetra fulgida]